MRGECSGELGGLPWRWEVVCTAWPSLYGATSFADRVVLVYAEVLDLGIVHLASGYMACEISLQRTALGISRVPTPPSITWESLLG